jgi:hypothetical protein
VVVGEWGEAFEEGEYVVLRGWGLGMDGRRVWNGRAFGDHGVASDFGIFILE